MSEFRQCIEFLKKVISKWSGQDNNWIQKPTRSEDQFSSALSNYHSEEKVSICKHPEFIIFHIKNNFNDYFIWNDYLILPNFVITKNPSN